jgi:hypothetical protein
VIRTEENVKIPWKHEVILGLDKKDANKNGKNTLQAQCLTATIQMPMTI